MSWKNERLKIFALWLFILFNIIFRDIHQMTLKSHLEMLLTGYYNGMEVTEIIMLFGAFVVNIPISMLLVSLFTKQAISRKLNMLAGSIMPLILLTSPPTDMDDIFHLSIEILALVCIVRSSFKWRKE
ncbi:hypothetical protein FDT66_13230 [Polaribacter aestuariivivens]|uniref:Uncharacterized protein n=1 Tax=Polaribacter aestuariivivens TaxID=2304626 RepID=A0A5S3N7M7_9FLAO|nr:hypothetical protein FDT66_13230 [Polaribacter aestuariivivens]